MKRIVIFTGQLTYSVRKGLAVLRESFPDTEFLVLHHRPPRRIKRVLRNQWRHLLRNGWRWIPHQVVNVCGKLAARVAPLLRRPPAPPSNAPGRQFDEEVLFSQDRITKVETPSLHNQSTLEQVRQFQPDLGIALAAPILRPELFEIPRRGTINLHKGKVPDYRGMPPAFWEFWHDEESVGCTIHRIERGLDTGDVLLAESVSRQQFSTVAGMQLMLDELGVAMMAKAVRLIAEDQATWTPQQTGGATYTTPTLKQSATMARKHGPVRDDSSLRFALKESVFANYLTFCCPVARGRRQLSGRRNVTVLLYHRVSDEFRDTVTVGVEQFQRQMAHLAARYQVVSIADIVEGRLPESSTGRPCVAVTFDDGYLDNFTNAVPILLRNKVPAAFFVSTGMIGQPIGFPHDLAKLGRALPNMTWDQLREMHRLGFTIGSHTVSHINCAQVDVETLRQELVVAKARLQEELGLEDVYFAYPYGKRTDMTQERMPLVHEAGYQACFSAYGGVNPVPVDRFHVLRIGVDYNYSLRGLAARIEGW